MRLDLDEPLRAGGAGGDGAGFGPSRGAAEDLPRLLNRIESSRCLEREAQRNIELMWLTGTVFSAFLDDR